MSRFCDKVLSKLEKEEKKHELLRKAAPRPHSKQRAYILLDLNFSFRRQGRAPIYCVFNVYIKDWSWDKNNICTVRNVNENSLSSFGVQTNFVDKRHHAF